MKKSYKYRIYPNKEQQEKISQFFGCSRKMYNLLLNWWISAYNEYIYLYSTDYLLVKEFYKEITLPEIKNWKDGTLLVRNYEGIKEYIVYSDEKSEIDGDVALSYVYANDHVCYANVAICDSGDFKPASVIDTNDFQELLHKKGKEWDFDNKKLIDWRWKPEINKDYWYINDIGEVCRTNYNKLMPNNDYRIQIGNCFKTKDDAFSARDKIDKILLNK